ncbi:hypothetical protein IU421_14890 [Nocardia cyriacigeorgica]|uniref:WDGH domain-containing protein n=1 Tax=Nocardia cyriacigeorgica TaxID=135487 RepID=UPI00189541A3|nr:hypothetical protein [Nocardia cyriacigeorgica]MBF6515557.1 hypothetical protein [Nocardia cyriacigeorgica]
MPDQNPTPLTDEHLRIVSDASHPDCHPDGQVRDMAAELLAARAVTPETSDGFHTFAELYHYRMLYNAALFNEWAAAGLYDVHKSVRHSDGSACFDGKWFVVYAQLPTGQISNHYEIATDWYKFRVPIRNTGAEWDGHTPQQAAERLAAFLALEAEGQRFSQRHLEQVTRQRDEARARIAELEQTAALAAACRPPEIHDRPTDTDLAALVRALEGTGDPAYVLGAELTEKRARVAELEDQVAFLADAEMERARLSLYARNARRTIRAVFESRRHWQDRTAGLEAERDKGYRDRAEVVAVLASIFPSQMADQDPETPGWPLLFLDTPEGQLSWHINPSDLDLFNTERYALALDEDPAAAPVWDGHTNEQKSARLHRLATCYQPADFLVDQHEVDVLRARVAELEADHARLVEDVASTVRRFSATLDERDALRARVAELEDQAAALADTEMERARLSLYARHALDAAGLHHLIDEDSDGDWGAVWERLAEMGAELNGLREVAEHHLKVIRKQQGETARLTAALTEANDARAGALERIRELAARIAELEAQQPYREVWSDEVAPGGRVCSICGQPVESEPCPKHAPAEDDPQLCDCGTCQAIASARATSAMASDRDPLAYLILDCVETLASPSETADYLIERGWRPPARVITDPAEADELPDGAVILVAGETVAARMSGVGGVLGRWWQVLDGDAIDTAAELMDLSDAESVTVLYVPTEES